MKKIFYIILLVLSFVSCETKKEHPLSPEFEEVRILMQTEPEAALLKLQNLKNSESQKTNDSATQKLSNSATQNLSNLEYSILLAEALYKNYLPQSNFDDIKAIVDYIEIEKTTSNSTLLIPNYLYAKAHYYHAVGLSEHNDIVGACEHYLKALEKMSEIKKLDNEQTRFLFLTYTRLGEMFFNEQYCDIAIVKFRLALKYAMQIGNNNSIARILKFMGNTYQLIGKTDSALYYLNKSLNTSSSQINELDVMKSVAKILFENGEKDSAYNIIKNNLDKTGNYNSKYSYHTILGDFYYYDKLYDSAIHHFRLSIESQFFYTKLNAARRLSAIYDSLNDNEKKAYFDNIISQLSIENINKRTNNAKIQNVYDKYKKRKNEREELRYRQNVYIIVGLLIILTFIMIMSIRQRYKLNHKELLDTIDSKDKTISEFNDKLSEVNKTNDNINFEAFHNSSICQKIINRKPSDFTTLSDGELALLLDAADKNLDNITKKLKDRYPKLKKDDFYYICLLLLNIEKNKFQYLLGRNRKTIWERLNKIKIIMNISDNDDLHIFMKNLLHKTSTTQ
ncbi:MAG: hypothetical protein J6Q39_12895 [Bacteroidales bacterium]|nr:hypothetical protein [Bacteroidales bacterium]